MTGEGSADGYLAFLAAREGEPDFGRHTLSRREQFFDGLARSPVRSRIPVDRAAYLRNLARRRPEAELDERTLWFVVTAKANQAERFGIGLAELYGGITADSDPVRVHIQRLTRPPLHCPFLFHVPHCSPGCKPSKAYGCLGNFREAWETAHEAAGLVAGRKAGGYVFHHTRNTAATDLRAGGMAEADAMKITGHKTRGEPP